MIMKFHKCDPKPGKTDRVSLQNRPKLAKTIQKMIHKTGQKSSKYFSELLGYSQY